MKKLTFLFAAALTLAVSCPAQNYGKDHKASTGDVDSRYSSDGPRPMNVSDVRDTILKAIPEAAECDRKGWPMGKDEIVCMSAETAAGQIALRAAKWNELQTKVIRCDDGNGNPTTNCGQVQSLDDKPKNTNGELGNEGYSWIAPNAPYQKLSIIPKCDDCGKLTPDVTPNDFTFKMENPRISATTPDTLKKDEAMEQLALIVALQMCADNPDAKAWVRTDIQWQQVYCPLLVKVAGDVEAKHQPKTTPKPAQHHAGSK